MDSGLIAPTLAIRRVWGPGGHPLRRRIRCSGARCGPAHAFGAPGPSWAFRGPQKRSSSPAFVPLSPGDVIPQRRATREPGPPRARPWAGSPGCTTSKASRTMPAPWAADLLRRNRRPRRTRRHLEGAPARVRRARSPPRGSSSRTNAPSCSSRSSRRYSPSASSRWWHCF